MRRHQHHPIQPESNSSSLAATTKPIPAAGPPRLYPSSVDAIRLLVKDFAIDGKLRGFKTTRILGASQLLRSGSHIAGYGSFMSWRRDNVRATLAPLGFWKGRSLKEDDVSTGCWVTFTPSRVLYRHNACILDEAEFRAALSQVEHLLRCYGLIVDLTQADLSRFELCRDVALPRPLLDYWPLLHQSHVPHSRLNRNFPSGLWRGGKLVRVSAYDKRLQLRAAEARRLGLWELPANQMAPGEASLPGPNTMRFEWQLRDPAAIGRTLGFKTVPELLTHFGALSSIHEKLISHSFLPDPPADILVREQEPGLTVMGRWCSMVEATGGEEKRVKELMLALSMERAVEELGWEKMNEALVLFYQALKKQPTLSKLRSSFQRLRLRYLYAPSGLSYGLLFLELRTTLLALQKETS